MLELYTVNLAVRNFLTKGVRYIILNWVYYKSYIVMWLIDSDCEVQRLSVNVYNEYETITPFARDLLLIQV